MTSRVPEPGLPTPRCVEEAAGSWPVRAVWVNELGGVTYEVRSEPEPRFVKWAPADSGLDLAAEADRLQWAVAFTPVPRLLESGHDDSGSWLITRALAGRMAIDPRWLAQPLTAVTAIGQGLRALHDRLPAQGCPFSWSAADRVETAYMSAPSLDPERWHRDHQHLTVEAALLRVADVPPIDQLVVCHGDTCAPNTLLTDDGHWSGHVDVGALGVADRWADLAVATWSTTWNYGPGWEQPLLDAYGIDPDPARTAYYRLLWDLG